jgi:hypothetical protein
MNIKSMIITGSMVGLSTIYLEADSLKQSLTQMLNEKETLPAMVNLQQLSQPKKVVKKPYVRSSRSVVATINGMKVLKKEADGHLKERTKGKLANFDLLPKKQRMMLIRELALPKIILAEAKKELSTQEKESAYSRAWMQKQIANTKVTDDEIHRIYLQMKQDALDHNATQQIPPYEAIKERLRMQIIDRKVIGKLMKNINITIEN